MVFWDSVLLWMVYWRGDAGNCGQDGNGKSTVAQRDTGVEQHEQARGSIDYSFDFFASRTSAVT